MKQLACFTFGVLFAGMLVSCAMPSPGLPTATSTPVPPSARLAAIPFTATPTTVHMIEPGDNIGDMVVTNGQRDSATEIWLFCDPYLFDPGVFTRECEVPAMQNLQIGYGTFADTSEELNTLWETITWELTLDDHQVDLSAFGTFDQDDEIDGPVKVRMWNVVLDQLTPGTHTLRYLFDEFGEYDVTWIFTVVGAQTYPTLSSIVSPGQHPYTSPSAGLNFLLYLPDEYGKDPQREWPLILYFHGTGDKGYDLEALKEQPLPETLEQEADFPFIVVSPQLAPELNDWSDVIDSLNILLDEIQGTVIVDSRRVYLTGLSMGGAGTWQFALRYPERFAALVPIAGYYLDEEWTVPGNLCALRAIPVWEFHGGKDSNVPLHGAEILVEAFKACGGNIQFTVYPDADHEETWRQAYSDSELYTWLLLQTRK